MQQYSEFWLNGGKLSEDLWLMKEWRVDPDDLARWGGLPAAKRRQIERIAYGEEFNEPMVMNMAFWAHRASEAK
jgi:hypothetical protein